MTKRILAGAAGLLHRTFQVTHLYHRVGYISQVLIFIKRLKIPLLLISREEFRYMFRD